MTRLTSHLIENPTEEDRQAVLKPLLAYNDTKTDAEETRRLAILLRDNGGEAKGGLWVNATGIGFLSHCYTCLKLYETNDLAPTFCSKPKNG